MQIPSIVKLLFFRIFNILPIPIQRRLFLSQPVFLNNIRFYDILKINFKKFSFIQIGANDGVSFDKLYEYLKKTKEVNGIVVEPVKEYFDELTKNYFYNKNIVCVNYALHPSLNTVTLFKLNAAYAQLVPNWAKGIASIHNDHHINLGIPTEYISSEVVNCISFDRLVSEYSSNRHFNYLQIDTEGFDAEIIAMINFSQSSFDIIKFERVNLHPLQYADTARLLKESGYFLIEEKEDTLAISKKIRLFVK